MRETSGRGSRTTKTFLLAHLAQLVARLPGWVPMVLERPEFDIAPKDGPKYPGYSIEKTATLLAELENNAKAGRMSLEKASDPQFSEQWQFKVAGNVMTSQTKYLALRTTVLNHLVHHRTQLALYLRLLDRKVPPMYGPTADDRMGVPDRS